MESQKKVVGKPFEPGNPGKPKGAVTKTNKLVKDFVAEVFETLQNSDEAKQKKADLLGWAQDNPKDFYTIAAKLIPLQMDIAGKVVHEHITGMRIYDSSKDKDPVQRIEEPGS